MPVVAGSVNDPVLWHYTVTNSQSVPAYNFTISGIEPPIATAASNAEATTACTNTIAANSSCQVTLEFDPRTQTDVKNETLSLSYTLNNEAFTKTFNITEQVLASSITATPSSSIIKTPPHTTTNFYFTLHNPTQSRSFLINTKALSIPSNSGIKETSTSCSGSFTPGSSCLINFSFSPVAGTQTGEQVITVPFSYNNQTQIPLKATVTTEASSDEISLTANSSGPITTLLNQAHDILFTLANNSQYSATGISPANNLPSKYFTQKTGNGYCGTTLNAGSHCTIDIVYAPTGSAPNNIPAPVKGATFSITYNQSSTPLVSPSFSASVALGTLTINKFNNPLYASTVGSTAVYAVLTPSQETYPIYLPNNPFSGSFSCGTQNCFTYAKANSGFPGVVKIPSNYPSACSSASGQAPILIQKACTIELNYTPSNDGSLNGKGGASHSLNLLYSNNGDTVAFPLTDKMAFSTQTSSPNLGIKLQQPCIRTNMPTVTPGSYTYPTTDTMSALSSSTETCTWELSNKSSTTALQLTSASTLSSELKTNSNLSLKTTPSTCSTTLSADSLCTITVQYKPSSATEAPTTSTLTLVPSSPSDNLQITAGLPLTTLSFYTCLNNQEKNCSKNSLLTLITQYPTTVSSTFYVKPDNQYAQEPSIISTTPMSNINAKSDLLYSGGDFPGNTSFGTPCQINTPINSNGCTISVSFIPPSPISPNQKVLASLSYINTYSAESPNATAPLNINLETSPAITAPTNQTAFQHASLNKGTALHYLVQNPTSSKSNFTLKTSNISSPISWNSSPTTLAVCPSTTSAPCFSSTGNITFSLSPSSGGAATSCTICATYTPTEAAPGAPTLSLTHPPIAGSSLTLMSTTIHVNVAAGQITPSVQYPAPDYNKQFSQNNQTPFTLPHPSPSVTGTPNILFVLPNTSRYFYVTLTPSTHTYTPRVKSISATDVTYASGSFPGVVGTLPATLPAACPTNAEITTPCSVELSYKPPAFLALNGTLWNTHQVPISVTYSSGKSTKGTLLPTVTKISNLTVSTDMLYAATSKGIFTLNPIFGNAIYMLQGCNEPSGRAVSCTPFYTFAVNTQNNRYFFTAKDNDGSTMFEDHLTPLSGGNTLPIHTNGPHSLNYPLDGTMPNPINNIQLLNPGSSSTPNMYITTCNTTCSVNNWISGTPGNSYYLSATSPEGYYNMQQNPFINGSESPITNITSLLQTPIILYQGYFFQFLTNANTSGNSYLNTYYANKAPSSTGISTLPAPTTPIEKAFATSCFSNSENAIGYSCYVAQLGKMVLYNFINTGGSQAPQLTPITGASILPNDTVISMSGNKAYGFAAISTAPADNPTTNDYGIQVLKPNLTSGAAPIVTKFLGNTTNSSSNIRVYHLWMPAQ